jgi:hypothetical protein
MVADIPRYVIDSATKLSYDCHSWHMPCRERCGPCVPASRENHMNGYRLYFLDGLGHIRRVVELFYPDDAAAVEAARGYAREHAMELWLQARCVQKFEAPQAASRAAAQEQAVSTLRADGDDEPTLGAGKIR